MKMGKESRALRIGPMFSTPPWQLSSSTVNVVVVVVLASGPHGGKVVGASQKRATTIDMYTTHTNATYAVIANAERSRRYANGAPIAKAISIQKVRPVECTMYEGALWKLSETSGRTSPTTIR